MCRILLTESEKIRNIARNDVLLLQMQLFNQRKSYKEINMLGLHH